MAHTNRFGVVFEDRFSTELQEFICKEAVWRNAYLDYRKKAWNRCHKDRLDPTFDAFWYDLNNWDLLKMGSKGNSGTEKDANFQENGVTSSD